MYVAYSTSNQEDEHSCLSDNTHRDLILNATGIASLYRGSYQRTSGAIVAGTSVSSFITTLMASTGSEVESKLDSALTAVSGLYVPFDQAIQIPSERTKVLDAIHILERQGDALVQAAALLGINITL